MAMDVKWILSASDQASAVFDKVKASATNSAEGISGAFGGVMEKFNLVKGGLVALAGVAAGGAFKTVIDASVNWNSEVVKLSKSLGMTTDQASIFNTALRLTGIESDTAVSAGMKLARTLGTNEEKFVSLGVATRDSSGKLRSTTDIMADTNLALSKLSSGTERNVAANEIYGRSWSDIQSLLKLTPELMKKAEDRARDLGIMVGPEGAEQTKQYKLAMNDIKLTVEALAINMGGQLLPTIQQLATFLAGGGGGAVKVFSYVFEALGKTILTVGKALEATGHQLGSFMSAAWSLSRGDIAGAKAEWSAMIDIGTKYKDEMGSLWTTWGKQATPTAPSLPAAAPTVDPAIEAARQAAELKATQIGLQNKLKAYQTYYDDLVKTNTAAMEAMRKDEQQLLDMRAKTASLTLQVQQTLMTPTEKYYSTVNDLESKQKAAQLMASDQKIKALGEVQQAWASLTSEIVDNGTVVISKEDAVAQSLYKIKGIGKEMEDAKINQIAVEAQAQAQLTVELNRVRNELDTTKSQLDTISTQITGLSKNIDLGLNDKATPLINQVQQTLNAVHDKTITITALYKTDNITGSNTGTAAVENIPQYATGTPYVPRTELALIHQGERIIPASQNTANNYGGVTINVSGGPTGDPKQMAKAIYGELQLLGARAR